MSKQIYLTNKEVKRGFISASVNRNLIRDIECLQGVFKVLVPGIDVTKESIIEGLISHALASKEIAIQVDNEEYTYGELLKLIPEKELELTEPERMIALKEKFDIERSGLKEDSLQDKTLYKDYCKRCVQLDQKFVDLHMDKDSLSPSSTEGMYCVEKSLIKETDNLIVLVRNSYVEGLLCEEEYVSLKRLIKKCNEASPQSKELELRFDRLCRETLKKMLLPENLSSGKNKCELGKYFNSDKKTLMNEINTVYSEGFLTKDEHMHLVLSLEDLSLKRLYDEYMQRVASPLKEDHIADEAYFEKGCFESFCRQSNRLHKLYAEGDNSKKLCILGLRDQLMVIIDGNRGDSFITKKQYLELKKLNNYGVEQDIVGKINLN